MGYKESDLPKTIQIKKKILSLPIAEYLSTSEIKYVSQKSMSFFNVRNSNWWSRVYRFKSCYRTFEYWGEVTIIDNFSTLVSYNNISEFSNKIRIIEVISLNLAKWMNEFKNSNNVFHLAALADIVPSIQNPDAYFKSNVIGTYNVLKASKKANINKLIYSASSSCYGLPKIFPTPENSILDPQYPYALTKKLGEDLVLHWAKIYKLPSISLRFFNVYGLRARTNGTYGAVLECF